MTGWIVTKKDIITIIPRVNKFCANDIEYARVNAQNLLTRSIS